MGAVSRILTQKERRHRNIIIRAPMHRKLGEIQTVSWSADTVPPFRGDKWSDLVPDRIDIRVRAGGQFILKAKEHNQPSWTYSNLLATPA